MRKINAFIVVIIAHLSISFAADIDVSKLPKLLGSNNMGREFYFTYVPVWEYNTTDLMIYISSSVRTKVTVEVDQKGYQETKYTIPNDILSFKLAASIGQAYRKDDSELPDSDKVWRGTGIHVFADDPIICYAVTRAKYTSDGFLVLPVNVLGNEYITASWADPADDVRQFLSSFVGVVATYDKTKMTFRMGGTENSKTAGGLLPGESSEWNMNAGDVFLAGSLGKHAELTGSVITATKPVAVVSGNFCAYIPTECGGCDYISEMDLPVYSWGTEYHVTPIVGREKHSMIKVFAKEPNTTIYRDFDSVGFIKTFGGIEGDGWLTMRADTGLPRPVVISGDKPINVTQYNTGQADDNVVIDPFQMVLVPQEQYQNEITFNTPGIKWGLSYAFNYINLCYESDTTGNIPDDIEIALYDYKDSLFNWFKLKDTLAVPGVKFANEANGKQFGFTDFRLQYDGVYKIRAEKPFQAYSYGWSSYDSYGFPASVALNKFSINDTLSPITNFNINIRGDVNVDTIEFALYMPFDDANRSNIADIYMHSDLSYNYKFYVEDYIHCEDSAVAWRLETIDQCKDAVAVLSIIDCAGNSLDTVIKYIAPKIKFVDTYWKYNIHRTDEISHHIFSIINFSDTANYNIINLQFINIEQHNFSIFNDKGNDTLSFPLTIKAGGNLNFMVKLSADTIGKYYERITPILDDQICHGIDLVGFVGEPIISISDINYDSTTVSHSLTEYYYIKNIGTMDLEIYGTNGPFNIGKYSHKYIFNNPHIQSLNLAHENPLIIVAGSEKDYLITFYPDEGIIYKDSVMFLSNTIINSITDSVCLLTGKGKETISVDEILNKSISISPNPANDILLIEFDEHPGIFDYNNVEIYDILGNKLLISPIENNDIQSNMPVRIDISILNSGVYYLVLTGSDNFVRKPFSVLR